MFSGTGPFTLTLLLGAVASGSYPFTITGTSGNLTHILNLSVTVQEPPSPTVYVSVFPNLQFVARGGASTQTTITAQSLKGYTGPVTFPIATPDAGISVVLNATTATIASSGSSVNVTATVTTSSEAAAGPHTLQYTATLQDGTVVNARPVTLVVN